MKSRPGQQKLRIEQARELDRVVCRFEQEFSAAWNRSPENHEKLREWRSIFDDMIVLLQDSLRLLFNDKVDDYLTLGELTEQWLPDNDFENFATLGEWNALMSEVEKIPRKRLQNNEALWALCPPVGTDPITLWTYTGPSAAHVINAMYCSFALAFDHMTYTAKGLPNRSKVRGLWLSAGEYVFPAFRMTSRFYTLPGEAIFRSGNDIANGKKDSVDPFISRVKFQDESIVFEIHELWVSATSSNHAWIVPSSASEEYEDYLESSNPPPIDENEDDEDRCVSRFISMGSDGPEVDLSGIFRNMGRPSSRFFEPMNNQQMAALVLLTKDAIATRRKAMWPDKKYERNEPMTSTQVREMIYYFAAESRDLTARSKAQAHIAQVEAKANQAKMAAE